MTLAVIFTTPFSDQSLAGGSRKLAATCKRRMFPAELGVFAPRASGALLMDNASSPLNLQRATGEKRRSWLRVEKNYNLI